jgi:hypothetical protein
VEQREPGVVRDLDQLLDRGQLTVADVGLAVVEVVTRPECSGVALQFLSGPVLTGQPAAVERAPDQHLEPVLLGHRQHGVLTVPSEDRVRQLFGGEALAAPSRATHWESTRCSAGKLDVPIARILP